MSINWTSFRLTNQVAIVTGASQGIGRTLAIGLARAGVRVVLVSRTLPALEEVAAEINALGLEALPFRTDLRDVTQIREMVSQVHKRFGGIDILINNAAWTPTVEALEVTEDEWDQTWIPV